MARSFYRPGPANTVEDYRVNNNYYHRASDTHFTMIERGGKYYQRRYQVGFQGEETNIDEKEIDFVMGSGSHARTYLHRTRAGALLELPLAWYAEKGGYCAMNPGYDKPDQPNARRKISLECMFCHNAYPDLPSGHDQLRSEPVFGGALPEGIDCQRCHGPGRRHVQAAQATGATGEAISQAIVNPARLTPARQMEVCMQCHLETTSFPFPHSILRYDRGPFSYQPGEPLGDFMLFFDHPPGGAQEDRLQIVNSVYRLEMSACFRKSNGKLQCTTCHDPHGEAAPKSYQDICRRCHATSFRRAVESGQHTASADCVRCHMPKRRTDDVVHAIMTDHFIQRRKPERDLLAEMPEPNGPGTVYHGRVLPYYPVPFERTAEGELYLALAQVRENNNSDRGIAQFAAAIAKYRPRRAEFYVELADARLSRGDSREATKLYEEAVRRKPDSLAGLLGLGRASEAARQVANAAEAFLRATQLVPGDALPWRELGQIRAKQAKHAEAVAALEESLRLDAEAPETHYALGTLRAQQGNSGGAEASFREAIRLKPDYAEAHMNLAILLFQRQRVEEAGYHFKSALRVRPDYLLGRLNYALMLNNVNRADEARTQLEAALRADPNFAQAHEELGKMAESAGRMEEAFNEYAEAVRMRPQLSRSQLGLGAALARNGNLSEAAKHLRQAATSSDAAVREAALRLLAELGQ
jgi:predicted CXXCH cytochrome family protein